MKKRKPINMEKANQNSKRLESVKCFSIRPCFSYPSARLRHPQSLTDEAIAGKGRQNISIKLRVSKNGKIIEKSSSSSNRLVSTAVKDGKTNEISREEGGRQ